MNLNWFNKFVKIESAPIQQIPLEKKLSDNYDAFKYLGILDTYGVSWSLEKVARDTLQNFFDGNNGNLDNVKIELNSAIKKSSLEDTVNEEEYTIRISNHAEYDFRRLMHLGATTKSEDIHSAGGFGEGTKILALALLRDYGFSQVRFGSKGWELDFLLETLPEEEYVEERKGLYAGVNKIKREEQANFEEFKTKNKSQAIAFIDAKKLFYNSDNEDFKNPTIDMPGVGGFKFLPKNKNSHKTPQGNLYIAGQRRHHNKEQWNTVGYLNLWTYTNDGLKKDRDRGVVTTSEIAEFVIPKIVDATPLDDIKRALYEMEPIWSGTFGYEIGYKMLNALVEKISKENIKLQFEDKYLSTTLFLPQLIRDNLTKEGYVICESFFGKIGMKNAATKFMEMQTHYRTTATTDEDEKIKILYEGVNVLQKEKKEIWLFDRKNEKSIIQGQYDTNFAWMSKESLKKPFSEALSIYLHEIDHKHGSDSSAEFSYALTDTLGAVINSIIQKPDTYKTLEERWNKQQT